MPLSMTISSKTDQPRHCTTFSPVARYEPRCPSGARCSTIVGTRASAPIARRAEHRVADQPADDGREQRLLEREGGHEQRARDDHEQADGAQRSARVIRRERTPRPAAAPGTGSIPTDGAPLLMRPSLRRYEPDQVRRV